MAGASTSPSPEDAERFRSFERQRHDDLATAYHDFFTPITGLAIKPLLDAVRLRAGLEVLDDVMVRGHQTTYLIPDAETLWRGGLGSLAMAGSAISHQDDATQASIRKVLERKAAALQNPGRPPNPHRLQDWLRPKNEPGEAGESGS